MYHPMHFEMSCTNRVREKAVVLSFAEAGNMSIISLKHMLQSQIEVCYMFSM